MSIVDNAKNIAELVKKYNDTELYQKIVDLSYEIFDIRDENLRLKEKISKLEKKESIEKELFFNGTYYQQKVIIDEQEIIKGIFCPKCWDDEKKLMRLQGNKNDMWQCPKCKIFYYGDNYRNSQPRKAKVNYY